MKVVLGGPPRSGKSCLRQGLKDAIRSLPGAPYPYVITACPDGEGAWFQETVENDAELAAQCKAQYKGKFSPEFVERIAKSVKDCVCELTIVDVGGIPSADNEEICAGATHMVILSGDPAKIPEWRAFAKKVGLKVLAEIDSDYHGTEDTIEGVGPDGIFRGSIHYLKRGEPVSERPTIKALAEMLAAGKEAEMPATYNVTLDGDILKVGFGEPAQNDQLVRDAQKAIKALDLKGGRLVKINGPASLPVAVVISHELGHLYETVAVFDPKLGKYVVSVTHGTDYSLGDLI